MASETETEIQSSLVEQQPQTECPSAAVLGLLDLTGAPIQHVLSFLPFADRLQKAETCKSLLEDVEALSSNQLEHIIMSHACNDADRLDFDARIRDQTNIDTSATRRFKPVHLPKRYLRWMAERKYVRTIPVETYAMIQNVAVSPSGNRIAFPMGLGDNRKVEIWNLATNTKLATIIASANRQIAFLAENRIVFTTTTDGGWKVNGYECWTEAASPGFWNRSGRLTTADDDRLFKFFQDGPLFPKSQNEIFVAVCEPTTCVWKMTVKIFSVDITVDSFVTNWEESMFDVHAEFCYTRINCQIVGVCGRWMILVVGGTNLEQNHLTVVDLQKNRKHHYWSEGQHVHSVKLSSECPKTLCVGVSKNFRQSDQSFHNHCYCILDLDEVTGYLSESLSILSLSIRPHVVAVSMSQFFVSENRDHDGVTVTGVSAYNLHTGVLERFMPGNSDWGLPSAAISSSRNELILTIPRHRGGHGVGAFCLHEPNI